MKFGFMKNPYIQWFFSIVLKLEKAKYFAIVGTFFLSTYSEKSKESLRGLTT